MKISEDYRPRIVCSLGLWEFGCWRLKAYTIAYGERAVDEHLVAAARTTANELLQVRAKDSHHYHVGFIGIHQGKTSNFVFIDWWADENELHHHIFISTLDRPSVLKDITASGISACVWDLELISFERDAWVDYVLKAPEKPDIEGYLGARLTLGPVKSRFDR